LIEYSLNPNLKSCRLREAGFAVGEMTPGRFNALSDVPGVRVGHTTLISGEGALRPGCGPVRTGVTVVLPHSGNLYREKVLAAVHTINGFGKAAGFEQVRELGLIEAPIALTNTLNVGLVLDALVQYSVKQAPEIGVSPESGSVNIVVGETNDGFLNDIQGRHVRAEHVWSAIEDAHGGKLPEGSLGAGTGTVCFGWKGGLGTASRVVPAELGGFVLGALVQSNFGSSRDLTVLGVPVGRLLMPEQPPNFSSGSVMVVLATDAPLDSSQLRRLCVRASAGLARTGAIFSHGSGDFVIAFGNAESALPDTDQSRAHRADDPRLLNALFRAVVETVEESVLNSLTCAEPVTGRDMHHTQALPVDRLIEMLEAAGVRGESDPNHQD
jgi:D-aminopeptidase